MKLPIGYDNFRSIIEKNLTFVDKSLFIKDFIDDEGTQVALITRPRRFGKTLNLSMLHHFFAAEVHGKPTNGLFKGLKIMEQGDLYGQHQGKYPVVFMSFKDIKQASFENAFIKFKELFFDVYKEYSYLLDSNKLIDSQKHFFELILNQTISPPQLESALKFITECLYQHHEGIKPLLLIDEYDTPVQAAYIGNYYDPMVGFMRGLFGAGLKGNPYLHRALLTGILRVSKESLFSGLNNLEVYSLLRPEYSQYFGFTAEEVAMLLQESHLDVTLEAIQTWYNGYQVGNTVVYNPWSIVNCIKRQGVLQPYWVNTSDNALIKELLIQSSASFKHHFEGLLEGNVVEKFLDENFVFPDLKRNPSVVWSLLWMTGYLKVVSFQETLQGTLCQLQIPNQEIKNLYRQIIEQWLSNGKGIEWYNQFLQDLLTGNVTGFEEGLRDIMLQTASVHDLAREPEAFYQGLMLGLTASLDKNHYEKKSNRESGYGRYDIAIIPKDTSKLAILLELKSVKAAKKDNEEDLDERLQKEARLALEQIENHAYQAELQQRGLQDILNIGLAFCGKTFQMAVKRTKPTHS